jgi:hypothetical protein
MHRITVDDSLTSQLHGANEPLVLCDGSGSALGHFVPIVLSGAEDDCPYSADELQRMRSEQGGRSWAEIKKSLGQQ